MEQVLEQEVLPLQAAFLDVPGKGAFALTREECHAAYLAHVMLHDHRILRLYSRHGAGPVGA
jgi:hypothetical protein